jgi:hypothetical protein
MSDIVIPIILCAALFIGLLVLILLSRGRFTWAEAWILTSIIPASHKTGRASLQDILMMADAIQHALPNYGEMDIALFRLMRAGHVIRDEKGFGCSDKVLSFYNALDERKLSLIKTQDEIGRFLGAKPWSTSYRPPRSRSGHVISKTDFDAAIKGYRGWADEKWKEIRNRPTQHHAGANSDKSQAGGHRAA